MSHSYRNALTLFDCPFSSLFFKCIQYVKVYKPSSTKRQNRWNFLHNSSSFFMMQEWRMNARADNSFSFQSIFQWKRLVSLCARNEKRLWATSRVTWSTVCDAVDFISSNWSANFKSILCCGSCQKNPHFLSPVGEYLTERTVSW